MKADADKPKAGLEPLVLSERTSELLEVERRENQDEL